MVPKKGYVVVDSLDFEVVIYFFEITALSGPMFFYTISDTLNFQPPNEYILFEIYIQHGYIGFFRPILTYACMVDIRYTYIETFCKDMSLFV